ncbi:DUF4124 domain-containing protein [Chitinilyticum piscinae]|uniref:DUF4124 domain-containing protein n=1 Tax=Chitinilyticum piscinae TaxID=2866724 RepID=A0A8J7K2G1_9NEIS|nr:DUF4124 domain-containing protein [Chitinilyticum piscinae]MBE9610436.1 DUF4124 domain-containing protein [Chitinilyticum piscinae]
MSRLPHLALLLLTISWMPLGSAAVYQWRDSQGNVHYTDQPPPGETVRQRSIRSNVVSTASETAQGATGKTAPNSRITLWIAPGCGAACEDAIALLDRRKVSYDVKNFASSEKLTIEFFNVTGTMQARPPVLQIGSNVVQPWDSATWAAALSSAGYR